MENAEQLKDATVKWFNDSKGYGFLSRAGDDKDVLVHYSAIAVQGWRTLVPGMRVRYAEAEGPRGLYAACVLPEDADARGVDVRAMRVARFDPRMRDALHRAFVAGSEWRERAAAGSHVPTAAKAYVDKVALGEK